VEDSTLSELKAKYGRVAVVAFREDIEIAIRAPSRAEYKVCRASMHNPASAPDAQEDLVRRIVVWCNGEGATDADARKAFDALLNMYPGLCENRAASGEISNFTGIAFRDQGKG
jgi:hypothetical protein